MVKAKVKSPSDLHRKVWDFVPFYLKDSYIQSSFVLFILDYFIYRWAYIKLYLGGISLGKCWIWFFFIKGICNWEFEFAGK